MSSIGAIGTLGSSTFCLSDFRRMEAPSGPELQTLFIAFSANLRKPWVWHAFSRLMTDENTESLSARKMMVVGRPVAGVVLQAAGPQVQLHQVGLMLDRGDRLVERLNLAANQEVTVLVDVQDEPVLRDLLRILDGTGRAGDRQMNPPVVVVRREVDHQHEEGDELEDDVEERGQVGLGPHFRRDRSCHDDTSSCQVAQADLAVLAAATSELMVRSATLVASMVIWEIRLRKKAKKKIAGTDSVIPSRVMKSAWRCPRPPSPGGAARPPRWRWSGSS